MKETILLIQFEDPARLSQVKRALLPLRMRLKTVEPEQYGLPVGVLAGSPNGARAGEAEQPGGSAGTALPGSAGPESGPADPDGQKDIAGPAEGLTGELLVMAGLSGSRLDAVLAALRKAKLRIPYKAMLTDANREWDVRKLHREIRSEHEAMNGGGQG